MTSSENLSRCLIPTVENVKGPIVMELRRGTKARR